MLADPRAKAKLHEFLLTWRKADQPRDLTKDTAKFPGFDRGDDLRSADVAGIVSRRRDVVR